MARHKFSILIFIIPAIILIASSCSGERAEFLTAPWMVEIHRNSLLTHQGGITRHCTGVIQDFNFIVTSGECIKTFPEHSQMIIYAGTVNEWPRHDDIQIFQPNDVLFNNNSRFALIKLVPAIVASKYVNMLPPCRRSACNNALTFGFQFGWIHTPDASDHLQVLQFDFSNSTDLCQQINENVDEKVCALLDDSQCNMNIGGEALMTVHSEQTILIGFWEHDNCTENIRVFSLITKSDPIFFQSLMYSSSKFNYSF